MNEYLILHLSFFYNQTEEEFSFISGFDFIQYLNRSVFFFWRNGSLFFDRNSIFFLVCKYQQMAPINPEQILDAFTPLLTDNGGIKPVDHGQFVKIYE